MSQQFTIGLSGHIDHGKTSIVKALTGKNTDNLQEEISRGMTINIGFAFINNEITLIDVPGHEKFIKNMVAGVNAIDYALLIIAADDGVMPQTIEHFEILKLLNIKRGAIVINKIDIVDEDWLEMIELDIYELTKNSFLENASILKVSAINDMGIKKLKNFLIDESKIKNEYSNNEYFRMFVDRVFSSKGFGQIVTGTVVSGSLSVGDKLKILPDNKIVKVRGLQTHEKDINSLHAGSRAAINIQSNEKLNTKRGHHLSDINSSDIYMKAIAKISVLIKHEKGIENNERVRVYLGTQETMARIIFYNNQSLEAGESAVALLKFEKNIVLSIFDSFILRTFSPLITIGGGKIFDVGCLNNWKNISHKLTCLMAPYKNEQDILKRIIEYRDEHPITFEILELNLSIPKDEISSQIASIENLVIIEDKWILTKKQYMKIKDKLIIFFQEFHKNNSFRLGLLKHEIIDRHSMDDKLIIYILEDLAKSSDLKCIDDLWSLKDFELKLNDKEQKIGLQMIELLTKQKFQTLTILELDKHFSCNKNTIKSIIEYYISKRKIVLINSELIFEKNNFKDLVFNLKEFCRTNDSINIKQFKDLANTTRKYAVPLLEYLDKMKITYREGNDRKVKK